MVSKIDAERYVIGVKTEVAVARVRARVASLHLDLARRGIRLSTVSERVPGAELFVIRPALVDEDELAPENMILCDLDARPVDGTPGSDGVLTADAAIHAHLHRGAAGSLTIVHAESGHTAAWAARGEAIPCLTTAMADEFGGAVPIIGTAGDDVDTIGADLAAALADHRSPAVLVPHQGAFVVAGSARDAARATVLLEDSARTAWFASAATPLPADLIDRRFAQARALREPTTDDRR